MDANKPKVEGPDKKDVNKDKWKGTIKGIRSDPIKKAIEDEKKKAPTTVGVRG
jgi:hypothetical protein